MVSDAREQRRTGYLDGLAGAAGHADRAVPLRLYCTGLLLPGERKSIEPMAARLSRTTSVACTSRYTIWWPMQPGAMRPYWAACATMLLR